jgi:hypothetical protein
VDWIGLAPDRDRDTTLMYICHSCNYANKINSVALVRFEVFMTVTMKNGVFWDVTPYGLAACVSC